MYRLRRFLRDRRRAGWEPEQAHAVQSAQQAPAESERIARLVSERLAEDERLRGGLTDAGFGPVLNLVTSMVPSAAIRATSDPNSTNAEDSVSHGARALTRAIVDAASTGDVTGLKPFLDEPILSGDAAERARAAIADEPQWSESPDERARRLVEILHAAIEEER